MEPTCRQHDPITSEGGCPLCGGTWKSDDPAAKVCTVCGFRRIAPVEIPAAPGPANEETPNPLDRWLAGEPIHPRPIGDIERARRWCSQRPALARSIVLATTAIALLAVVSSVACLVAWNAASRQAACSAALQNGLAQTRQEAAGYRRAAQAEQAKFQREQAAGQTARQQLAELDKRLLATEQARAHLQRQQEQAVAEARLTLAREMADQSRRLSRSRPMASLLLAGESMRYLLDHAEPDQHVLDQSIRNLLADLGEQRLPGHSGSIQAVAVSADGRWLATGSDDKTVRLWDLKTKDPQASCHVLRGHVDRVAAVKFTPDGRWLITGSDDATARLWDLRGSNPPKRPVVLQGHRGRVAAIAVSADGHWLATAAAGDPEEPDTTARLWNLQSEDPGRDAILLRGHEAAIGAVAFTPDSRWVITAGADHTVRMFDLAARFPAAEQIVLEGHHGSVRAIVVSGDGRFMVTAGEDSTTRVWDLREAHPATDSLELRGHRGPVLGLAVSPEGRWIATAGVDRNVRLWNMTIPHPAASPMVLAGHTGPVSAVAFSPNGRWLVSASQDETLRLWDLCRSNPAEDAVVLRGHGATVTALAITPDSRYLVSGCRRTPGNAADLVRCWDMEPREMLETARAATARRMSHEEITATLNEAARTDTAVH